MREVKVGAETREIHASPLSAFIYEQAFGYDHDINADANAIMNAERGPFVVLPAMTILRLLYTYEATVIYPTPHVVFSEWVKALPDGVLDHTPGSDGVLLINAIMDETVGCFFRRIAEAAEDVGASEQGRDADEGAAEGA